MYSEVQKVELEKEFLYNQYITIQRKSELAAFIGLSDRQVGDYFILYLYIFVYFLIIYILIFYNFLYFIFLDSLTEKCRTFFSYIYNWIEIQFI